MKQYQLRDLGQESISALCRRNPVSDPAIMETCRGIFEEVSAGGDEALRDCTRRFDHVELSEIRVAEAAFSGARSVVPSESIQALERAARNIRTFHEAQRLAEEPMEVETGVRCWRESRPIGSVGLYVPGGSAVLPSTVLMLGIPARLAGCSKIILCVPPRQDASVSPEVLLAAKMAGISAVFSVGGAQAIAAMAAGTETIPKVDKILGPGSRWVQTAKLLASLEGTAIDMVAGPTEVLVIADDSARAQWVASDLIAQAEHGSDSQAILVSTSGRLVEETTRQLGKQMQDLPRKAFASDALRDSFSLLADSVEEAFAFANLYAPEHLILHLQRPRDWIERVHSAGSVFLGGCSPEVAGDYASGTNHTLPTSGLARAFSGVSLDSFVKKITFQELSRQGLQRLGPTLETLARLEGLEGHRRAVTMRLDKEPQSTDHGPRATEHRPRTTDHGPQTTDHRAQTTQAQKTSGSRASIQELVRPNILQLEPYQSARESIQEGVLLDANENPYPSDVQGIPLNRYPDPFQRKLRESIARYLGVAAANVAAGAGSDEVLDWIFKVFCQPGEDQVAIAEPTYGMYRVTADIFGVRCFEFSLNDRFGFTAETFLQAVPGNVKVLFLCSPNNPTGNLLNRNEILSVCRAWEKIVVVDEAYVEFADEPSLASEIQEHSNLILLRTMSKAFGRAALRLGYAVASEEIISLFLKVKAPYNLNALSMENGQLALEQLEEHQVLIQRIQQERERMVRSLKQIPHIQEIFASQANFLLLRCPRASEVYERLLEKGIVVRDRSGPRGLENCLRITIGSASENDSLLDELRNITEAMV